MGVMDFVISTLVHLAGVQSLTVYFFRLYSNIAHSDLCIYYRPPKNLWESIVFSHVCLFTWVV